MLLASCGKSRLESFVVRPTCPLNAGSGRGKTSCALAGDMPDSTNSVIGSVQREIRRVKVKKFILSSFFKSKLENENACERPELARRVYIFTSQQDAENMRGWEPRLGLERQTIRRARFSFRAASSCLSHISL